MTKRNTVDDHIALAHRLNDLHQLIYARGGIRPSNAAVEELAKLLLLRIAAERHPDLAVARRSLGSIVTSASARASDDIQLYKRAFAAVNKTDDLAGRLPTGELQSVWPVDEPLRLTRSDVLAEALTILEGLPTESGRGIDALGTAFDVFLRGRYEHAGGLGTYLTPEPVVRMMSTIGFDLIDPFRADTDGPVMGDPCCGTGRFLVGMLDEARRRGQDSDVARLSDSFFGADQSASSVAMARVNLLAYGLSHPEVFTVEDSIVDSSLDRLRGRVRLILTNPPFGDAKYDSREGISRTAAHLAGVAGKDRIDPALAFVARCVDLLASDGVLGIILPDGVADGAAMREFVLQPNLMNTVRLEGVVSLPTSTFAPAGTMAKTSVVFLRKTARTAQTKIFLARSDHVGYLMKKGSVVPDPDGSDLDGIAASVGRLRKKPRGDSHVLVVPLEDQRSIDASTIDPAAVAARSALINAGGRPFSEILRCAPKRRAEPRVGVPFVSVLHVDELGNVDWLQATQYSPTTPGLVARRGDVIVSLLNPAKFRASVVPAEYEFVHCSAEFGVFEPTLNPYAALALLQHRLVKSQIAPLGRGTSSSRRRIERNDVLTLVAPPFTADWAEKAGRLVLESLDAIAEARAGLVDLYGEG